MNTERSFSEWAKFNQPPIAPATTQQEYKPANKEKKLDPKPPITRDMVNALRQAVDLETIEQRDQISELSPTELYIAQVNYINKAFLSTDQPTDENREIHEETSDDESKEIHEEITEHKDNLTLLELYRNPDKLPSNIRDGC
jgi:hypothetical protein